MATFEIQEAESRFLELIARAEGGEDIVVTRGGVPVVRLTALAQPIRRPQFGSMKGKVPNIPDEFFFDPLPEEELRAWEGSDDASNNSGS